LNGWPARITRALAALSSVSPQETGAPAAVLVPLVLAEHGPLLWLVRRSSNLRHHPGQIALPGGKHDPADAGPHETALREAHEEIHLPPAQVQVLGQLPPRLTSSRFLVVPVVGLVPAWFTPVPQPGEVDRVFLAPLRDFEGPGELHVPPSMPERGPVPSYFTQGEVVWGATAAILATLARACRDVQ
jgi:8-oxo-dGTP pyrophosphatase MutT (NUDIX family)